MRVRAAVLPCAVAVIFPTTHAYFSADTDARGWAFLDDTTFNAAAFAIARAAKNAGQKAYYYRFNAPQTQRYPAYYGASHSADKYVRDDCVFRRREADTHLCLSWHLQNSTTEMNATEAAVARE